MSLNLIKLNQQCPNQWTVEDCTKEVLPGVETETSSDKEDQNITTEQPKMIAINVCDGDKVAILIINIE